MNRLERLHSAGVSIWLDTLSRELLDTGAFATLIADAAVTDATSNPTIFAKAITSSDRYDYRERFADQRWLLLRDAGARPQRPLWASTGTKDAAYSDLLYVQQLVAPEVINTMPESTLHAFSDHGDTPRDFTDSIAASAETLRRAERAGLDLAHISSELEREGVRAFCDSYQDLLACIETKLRRTAPAMPARS
jgi:transaldolase